jgi:hypothetical protein
MTLDELLSNLANGELTNLSMSKGGNITEEKIPSVVLHINDGLMRLYSRFILKEGELLLEQVEHITQYHLKSEFSESRGDGDHERYLYIKDMMGDPFEDDVIKVLEVWDTHIGKLPLNDPDQPWTLRTPQPTTIQIPNPVDGRSVSVVYQASHPVLSPDELDAPVDLPLVLQKALTSYVASKVFSDMSGQDNLVKAQEHTMNYESICAEAIDRDLVNSSYSSTNTKFCRRGFL